MRITLKLFLLVTLLCSLASATSAQNPDTEIITKFIAGQAAAVGGEEYEDARKVIAGDVNGDGVPDLAVLYTIEGVGGGNNYTQYLAVFIRLNGRLNHVAHTVVGGKLIRAIELKSITKNLIHCTTLRYGPKDPSCCPTRKGTARFALTGRRLKEV